MGGMGGGMYPWGGMGGGMGGKIKSENFKYTQNFHTKFSLKVAAADAGKSRIQNSILTDHTVDDKKKIKFWTLAAL